MEVLPFQPLTGEQPMLDIPFVVGIDGRQFRGERLVEQLKGLNRQAVQGICGAKANGGSWNRCPRPMATTCGC